MEAVSGDERTFLRIIAATDLQRRLMDCDKNAGRCGEMTSVSPPDFCDGFPRPSIAGVKKSSKDMEGNLSPDLGIL